MSASILEITTSQIGHEEINTVTSPDVSVTKTERFNSSRLLQLLNNPNVPSDEKAKLRAIKNNAYNLCYLNVTYKLGGTAKMEQLGRYYAMKGIGAQSLSRDIRNALYGEYYHDIDIVNCQPTLLYQICEREGWKCDNLKEFCYNREKLLEKICEALGCDRTEAKKQATAIMFGASPDGLPSFFEAYANELRVIRNNVWNANKTKLRHLSKKPNFLISCLAHVLQTEENKCLMAIDASLCRQKRSMDSYIFDGGLVAKKDETETLDESILRKAEKDVLDKTNYNISLAVKPMQTTIVFTDLDDEYNELKSEFEKEFFKLKSPQCFAWVHDNIVELLKIENLKHLKYSLKLKSGKRFLDLWIDDPDILTYDRLEFCPKAAVPDGCFNLFTKFDNDAVEGDYSAYSDLVKLTCNNDSNTITYLENWLAHIIQKPYEKTGICICIQGEEGVGKDSFFNAIGDILGKRYFFNTSTPENDVFHSFNTGTESAVLVKFEEANFKTNRDNQNKLKSIITSKNATYRKKGFDTVALNDFRNIVMTTNEELPIVIDDTDRRFVLIQASSERRGDTYWWKELHEKLISQASAYHHYLLSKDISQFNPRHDRVETQAYRDAKSMTAIPYHASFFQRLIEEMEKELKEEEYLEQTEYKAKDLYDKLISVMGEKCKISMTKFGLDLRKHYVDKGVRKFYTRYSAKYVINPNDIMQMLKDRHWWLE